MHSVFAHSLIQIFVSFFFNIQINNAENSLLIVSHVFQMWAAVVIKCEKNCLWSWHLTNSKTSKVEFLAGNNQLQYLWGESGQCLLSNQVASFFLWAGCWSEKSRREEGGTKYQYLDRLKEINEKEEQRLEVQWTTDNALSHCGQGYLHHEVWHCK